MLGHRTNDLGWPRRDERLIRRREASQNGTGVVEARPVRVQRTRKKGGGMISPNGLPVVYVGRPSVWANPFLADRTRVHSPKVLQGVMEVFRLHVQHLVEQDPDFLEPLRGKNLACWCPLTNQKWEKVYCHADVLLEMANG